MSQSAACGIGSPQMSLLSEVRLSSDSGDHPDPLHIPHYPVGKPGHMLMAKTRNKQESRNLQVQIQLLMASDLLLFQDPFQNQNDMGLWNYRAKGTAMRY